VADPKRPTEAETEILAVLWECGPSTVRAVHEVLAPARGVGYTTVLKLLQIMADKGLVTRDASQRSHVYAPAVEREAMQTRIVDDLVDRVFAGSTCELVVRALSGKPASAQEIAEIRKMLDALEGGRR
jgi:predicted transcriptional regulator